MIKINKKRLRWWLKRLAIAFVLLLLLGMLVPFLFTTTLVRRMLARSAYAKFSPEIASASLSLGGTLTIHDLQMYEAGTLSDAPLIFVRQASVRFSWFDIWGMKLSGIDLDGLDLHVRPGRTHAITLLTLAYPPTVDGAPPEPIPPSTGNPLWFDHLHVSGTLKIHPFEDFRFTTQELPLIADVSMHGPAATPQRDLVLALGEPALARAAQEAAASQPATAPATRPALDTGPALSAAIRIAPEPGGRTQISVDHLEVWNAEAAVDPELLRKFLPQLPRDVRDRMSADVDRISLSGVYNLNSADDTWDFTGDSETRNLSLTTPYARTQPLAIDRFSTTVHLVYAHTATGDTLALQNGTTRFSSLDVAFADLHGGRTTVEWAWGDSELAIKNLQANIFDGSIGGAAHINFANLTTSQGNLTLEHIDESQMAALLPAAWRDQYLPPMHGHIAVQAVFAPQGVGGLSATLGLAPANDWSLTAAGVTFSVPGPWTALKDQPTPIYIKATAEKSGGQWHINFPALAAAALRVQAPEIIVRRLVPNWPSSIHGPLELNIGTLHAPGVLTVASDGRPLSCDVALALTDVDLRTVQSTDTPAAISRLALSGQITVPFIATAEKLVIRDGQLHADALQFGKLSATTVTAGITAQSGALIAKDVQCSAFGGQWTGQMQYHLVPPATGPLMNADLQIAHLDQHPLLANVSPDNVDAEGPMSGTVSLWLPIDAKTHQVGTLQMKADLTADAPGRLHIKNEEQAQKIASAIPPDVAGGLLPKDFGSIVVGQLKNYPYLQGHVEISMPHDHPQFHLTYRRPSLVAGEPGYNVPIVVNGMTVAGSLPVQLTVDLDVHYTVTQLLAMIAGLEDQISAAQTRPH